MVYPCIQNAPPKWDEWGLRAAGARWRFYPPTIIGLLSNRLYIGGSNSSHSDIIWHHTAWHQDIAKDHITWHDKTGDKKSHHIKWLDMTWHRIATLTSQPSTLLHLTPQLTSWRRQNKSHHHHGTSPPWNGWRLVRSHKKLGLGIALVYRQILSLVCSSFPSETSAPCSPGNCWYNDVWIISSNYVSWWSNPFEKHAQSSKWII